ncbi:DUF3825 domain-containing protein [Desulfosporosinus sp. FKA]|uniref:DUF3825 domain-containing protein n=1 Tax=Desulfosporosinus sp. FKA TaxID=1969834 RepID=UPI000B49816C|nr:DUF3825 domain-containing protein [Desulfosporosinus sp. FKA]
MAGASDLYNWANCTDENRKLNDLASLSFPKEDWSGVERPCKSVDKNLFVLWKYIHHTFGYLTKKEPHKIFENSNYACFNTGLETEKYEEIFAIFKRVTENDKFELVGFYEETNNILNVIRGKLPEPANYIINPSDFIFDATKEMNYSLNHILDERQGRLPKVIKTIPEDYREDVIVNRMRNAYRRLKRNYKLAIPQYSPRHDEIQLLIPVCVTKKTIADCALAVRKIDDVYIAKTILTLDMAYNNARLITRPDPEWLQPLKDANDIKEDDIIGPDES